MDLGFDFGLSLPGATSAPSALAPDAMITGLTVHSDGWKLTGKILNARDGGTWTGLDNAAAPGLILFLTSKSWTETGVETTTGRAVFATSVLRQPYPIGGSLEETENGADLDVVWSLSERIFAGEVISAATIAAGFFVDNGVGGSSVSNPGGSNAVTNSSLLAYYQPQACWMTPPEERIDSAAWAPRLFVMHRHARLGTPVRAVEFIATGETSAVEVSSFVTDLTTGPYSASGLFANWYEPVWDLSGMTDGEKIKVNARVYPWIGDVYDIELQAETYPSPYLTVLKGWCDAGGTARKVYVTYDGVGGVTPTPSTDPAVADANPYASASAAMDAAEAFGGVNTTDGVIFRIAADTDLPNMPWIDTNYTSGDIPLVIEGVDRATSSFTTNDNRLPHEVKFRNLTMKRAPGSGTGQIGFRGKGSSTLTQIVSEDVTFDLNGEGYYQGWWYYVGRQYFINCDGDSCGQGYGGSGTWVQCHALAVGQSRWTGARTPYFLIASDVVVWGDPGNQAASVYGAPQGPICAFNRMSHSGVTSRAVNLGGGFGDRGFAVVGNIMEAYGDQNTTNFYMSADNDSGEVINGMEAHNTVVGERTNVGYMNSPFNLKDIVSKHSLHWKRNTKTDYFASSSVAVLNWALRHDVDGGHILVQSDSKGSGYTSGSYLAWLIEALGDDKSAGNVPSTWVVAPQNTWGFVNDQSNTATGSEVQGGAGGGDYTPAPVNIVPQIPAGETMFAVDLFGRPVPTDGTAYAGAVQQAA